MKLLILTVLVFSMSEIESLAKQDQSLAIVSGTLQGNDVFCPQFKLIDGETISLSGDFPKAASGTKFELIGRWREKSKCMRGRELRVKGIKKIDD